MEPLSFDDYSKLLDQLLPVEHCFLRDVYLRLFPAANASARELLPLLYRHSRDVAELALEIADRHPELSIDRQFVLEAALLHDVGIVFTNAPGIHCFGREPYIRHGCLGSDLLLSLGMPRHAAVARRHTGAGIAPEEIRQQRLPLSGDCLPLSIEEKLVCYADKFYSKSHPESRKSMAAVRRSLEKFGGATIERFDEMVRIFGEV